MINFRYHLVSLTAIFLALGLGIAMGAAVVDRALVSTLEDQLGSVGRRADSVAERNDRLQEDLGTWETFASQAGDSLVAGRLAGVPVALITVAGVDRDQVAQLRGALQAAGAGPVPELVLTSKFALDDPGASRELATLLGIGPVTPAQARSLALDQLAQSWAGGGPGGLAEQLRAAAFIEAGPEPAGAPLPELAELAPRFLVVSSAGADVDDELLARPLVAEMAERNLPTVAADLTEFDAEPMPGQARPAPFVGPLREEAVVRAAVSTVDQASGFRGRVATVLALVDLGAGRVGHYGTAAGAERLLPD